MCPVQDFTPGTGDHKPSLPPLCFMQSIFLAWGRARAANSSCTEGYWKKVEVTVSAAVTCCCFSFEILTIPDSAYGSSLLDATWYMKYLHYQQWFVNLNRVFLEDSLWREQEVCLSFCISRLGDSYQGLVCEGALLPSLPEILMCVAPSNSLKNCSGSKVKLRYLSCSVSLKRIVQIIKSLVDL